MEKALGKSLDESNRFRLARITSLLDDQRHQLLAHPFLDAAHLDSAPRHILRDFAFHQYSDSILWVPMLSLMRSKVSSPRLSRALAENIAHETGLDGPSHIALARDMMRSLGVRDLCDFPAAVFVESATLWLSDEFASYDEAAIAGWLLTAETLVPLMFARVVAAMAHNGCDVEYFTVHVHVDGDEHAEWMLESVREIVEANPEAAPSVMRGMQEAFREVVEVPDLLWSAR